MIPILVTLFATDGLALGATLAGTDAAMDSVGAVDGAPADGLAVPALVQAPAMREMAARLAAHAESRGWVGG
jgi:hypothetical protein